MPKIKKTFAGAEKMARQILAIKKRNRMDFRITKTKSGKLSGKTVKY